MKGPSFIMWKDSPRYCVGCLKNQPILIWLTIRFPPMLFLLCLDIPTFLVFDWSVFHLDCLVAFSLDKSIALQPFFEDCI